MRLVRYHQVFYEDSGINNSLENLKADIYTDNINMKSRLKTNSVVRFNEKSF